MIVIMTDDQGTADLGAAGATDVETPHLDALARRGVRFSQFYAAAPVCSPSRAGLLTGRHPFRAGMPFECPGRSGCCRHARQRDHDRRDAQIGRLRHRTWSASGTWASARKRCRWGRASTSRSATWVAASTIIHISFTGAARTGTTCFATAAKCRLPGRFFGDLMVEEAGAFLERNRDRPFFLYFAINAPHYPYQGDPKWLARYAGLKHPRNLYAAFLSTMDERIGRLMAEGRLTRLARAHDRDRPVRPRPFDRRAGVLGRRQRGHLSRRQVQPVRGRHPRAGDHKLARPSAREPGPAAGGLRLRLAADDRRTVRREAARRSCSTARAWPR